MESQARFHREPRSPRVRDNGTFIKSRHQQHVICIQASKRASLNSFFISTTLLSLEQLIHLDYFTWRRVEWWRDGFLVRVGWWRDGFSLVASWLVAKLPGGEMTGYRDKGSRQ